MRPELVQAFDLHPYQQEIADFVLRTPRCGLFLPVGAGKTRIVLSVLTELNPGCHILVIAPAPIARISWQEEIEKTGAPIRYDSFSVGPRGGKPSKTARHKKYEKTARDAPTLYTISRDLVPDLVEYFGQNWPFPIVVIDELQSFKNPSGVRFKALKKVMPKTYRFMGLTGTPAPQGVIDLWPQIWFMDGGQRLGPNITRYREAFFDEGLRMNGYCVKWNPKTNVPVLDASMRPVVENGMPLFTGRTAKDEIYRRIRDIVVSVDISDQIALPDCIHADHRIPLDDAETALYEKLVREKVLTLYTADEKEEVEVTAANAGVLASRLAQMASGALYVDEDHNYVRIHDKKLDMLQYIMDNEPDPVLVAYYFKTDLYAIQERFPEAVPFSGEPGVKKKWDQGKIRMMCIHPASVGFGLNLQDGGHTLVWYTLPWSLEHYVQTNGRIYRQGQKFPTVIHYLEAKGTIDERIRQTLLRKDADQGALLTAVSLAIRDCA